MSATTDSVLPLQRTLDVLRRARERAAMLGRPVLTSCSVALPGADMPDPTAASHYFVWEQPERDVALCAVDEAVRLEATGESRFAEVRDSLQRLLAEAVIDHEGIAQHPASPQAANLSIQPSPSPPAGRGPGGGVVPLCFAGFAFDPQRRDDTWQPFPDALAVVPRLLFRRTGDNLTLTANLLVDANADLDRASQALSDDAAQALTRTMPPGSAGGVESPSLTSTSTGDRAAWAASVRALTDQIARERVDKVVLARCLELRAVQPFDVAVALARLRERYRNCTIFAAGQGDAVFLGATPEMLVRREGRSVRADCMAGSAARGRDTDEDEALGRALLSDDKELREHALVTQGMRQSLDGLCDELIVPTTPVLRRMANVQHLYTPIQATAREDRHILDFVERLHPTPAVAGLPRERSLCLIREQERFSRGWYAGPIGWLDAHGDGEFAVALRSALVRGDTARLYAGCGIVAGSDPGREYEESRIKLQAMTWALGGSQ